jgi:hypothetical protein
MVRERAHDKLLVSLHKPLPYHFTACTRLHQSIFFLPQTNESACDYAAMVDPMLLNRKITLMIGCARLLTCNVMELRGVLCLRHPYSTSLFCFSRHAPFPKLTGLGFDSTIKEQRRQDKRTPLLHKLMTLQPSITIRPG